MRRVGFALFAVAVGVTTGLAQSPGVPASPATPPPLPAAVAPPAQKLDSHLAGWEKRMADLKNFRFDLALKRTDPAATGIFKGDRVYTGEVLCMKPNLARLRLVNAADPRDYEAFICNGKSLWAYSGLNKTVTHHKLPDPRSNPTGATDNLILDFVSGMKAKDLKDRFDLSLFKEDEYYIYLDIQPRLGKDKQDFRQLRLALYGPKTEFAYLPAQVYLVRPNGETEQWKLSKPMINIANLDPRKVFEYEPVKDFKYEEAPDTRTAPAARTPRPTPPSVRPPRP